jgi:hypothetical protein
MNRWLKRGLVISVAGLLVLCLLTVGLFAVLNGRLPTQSDSIPQLSTADKGRLAEYFHLQQSLGDAVWPGFGQADIPVILYNEEYAFLVGVADPADGWQTVPTQKQQGTAWEGVPNDSFAGQPYFRQRLVGDVTPQAFTVRVGDQWAASMTAMQWMRIELANVIRRDLPPGVQTVFPYWLMVNVLVESSDHHIALVAHEAFHAFQGVVNEGKLAAAETAVTHAPNYPIDDPDFQAAWQNELDLLAQAVQADTQDEMAELAAQFLAQRQERRQTLSADQITYEQTREWEEGLAKYVELAIWQQAATTDSYTPVLADDPEFDAYQNFANHWRQEIAQMKRMASDDGDGRFYYSGMAQAFILDQLLPGWKEQALDDGVYLEDLLGTATTSTVLSTSSTTDATSADAASALSAGVTAAKSTAVGQTKSS